MYYLIHPILYAALNIIVGCRVKSSLLVNILNHTFISVYSLWAHFSNDMGDNVVCGELLLSYMIYDLARMLTTKKYNSYIFIVHHLATIGLLHGMFVTGRYHEYFPVICLFELSSVPLNCRYLLRQYGMPNNSRWIVMLEIWFFVTFVFVRFIFGGRHVSDVWVQLDYSNSFDMFLSVVIVMFVVMHLYWVIGIINKKINQAIKKII